MTMRLYAGRDMLLKTGDGGSPQHFITVGAARLAAIDMTLDPAETTAPGDAAPTYAPAAGRAEVRVSVQGLFCGSAAEARIAAALRDKTPLDCQMIFPDGAVYAACFVIESLHIEGGHEGLAGFSAGLRQSGTGTWTTA
jgi:predicted secreted protein